MYKPMEWDRRPRNKAYSEDRTVIGKLAILPSSFVHSDCIKDLSVRPETKTPRIKHKWLFFDIELDDVRILVALKDK